MVRKAKATDFGSHEKSKAKPSAKVKKPRARKTTPKIPAVVRHAILCARVADDKKAEEIIVLDLRGKGYVADIFVIATGRNERQRAAIAAEIKRQMHELGDRPFGFSGEQGGSWVLLDFVDLVIHVFSPDARRIYDLELLWGDAPRIDWSLKAPDARQ